MSTGSAFTPLIEGIRVLEPLLTLTHDWGATLATLLEPESQEVTGFGLSRGGIDRGILLYRMGESHITAADMVGAAVYHVQLHVSPTVAAPATALGMAQDSQVLMEYGYDRTQASAVGTTQITIEQLTDTPPEAMLLVQNPSLIAMASSSTRTQPVVRFWYKWVEMERALFNALVRR